jgi:hypothetical protein
MRMQRWNNGPFDWPPPAVAGATRGGAVVDADGVAGAR